MLSVWSGPRPPVWTCERRCGGGRRGPGPRAQTGPTTSLQVSCALAQAQGPVEAAAPPPSSLLGEGGREGSSGSSSRAQKPRGAAGLSGKDPAPQRPCVGASPHLPGPAPDTVQTAMTGQPRWGLEAHGCPRPDRRAGPTCRWPLDRPRVPRDITTGLLLSPRMLHKGGGEDHPSGMQAELDGGHGAPDSRKIVPS